MNSFKAWLELGRISNLPTVWSNVIHGLSVGFFVAVVQPIQEQFPGAPPVGWRDLGTLLNHGFVLMLGMSLLYTGGMVLNDVCDKTIDAAERPARPIPSGRVSCRSALVVAIILLVLGWLCLLVYRPTVAVWGGVLVFTIVGYNLMHGFRAAGLFLMPVCRGLVIWISASAVSAGVGVGDDLPRVLGSVVAIGCYTLIVTLIAWGEALPSMRKLAPWIGVMIAGMAVVDAAFVWLLGMPPMAFFCLACAGAALIGQRWVRGS